MAESVNRSSKGYAFGERRRVTVFERRSQQEMWFQEKPSIANKLGGVALAFWTGTANATQAGRPMKMRMSQGA